MRPRPADLARRRVAPAPAGNSPNFCDEAAEGFQELDEEHRSRLQNATEGQTRELPRHGRPPLRGAAQGVLVPRDRGEEERKDSARRSQFSTTEAYRKAVAQQRRKRRRTEAQLERNLNRSDIEEASGDEHADPDFCSERSSFAALVVQEREEKKVRQEEAKPAEKVRENFSSGPLEPLLLRAFRVQRALGGYALGEFRRDFAHSRPVRQGHFSSMAKARDRDGHLRKAFTDKDFCPEFPLQISRTQFGNDVVEGAVEGGMPIPEVFRRKMFYHAWKSVTKVVDLAMVREHVERSVQNTLAAKGIYHPTSGEVPNVAVSSMFLKNVMAKLYLRFLSITQEVSGVRDTGGVQSVRTEQLLQAHRVLRAGLGGERPSDMFVRECGRRMFEQREAIDAEVAREEEDARRKVERGGGSESESEAETTDS